MTSTITLITGEGNVRLYGDNLVLDLRAGGVDAMLNTLTNSPNGHAGETGMVLGTGKERPLSAAYPGGYPEARFETVSLHQNEPEAAAEAAGDYLREPVAAEQGQIIREGDAPRETDRESGDASCPDTDFSSAPPAEAAPAFPKQPPTPAGAADIYDRSAISAGFDGNPSKPSPAAGRAKMEGAATAAPDRPDAKSEPIGAEAGQAVTNCHRWSKLRPLCQSPEKCAGYGTHTCHLCLVASQSRDAV